MKLNLGVRALTWRTLGAKMFDCLDAPLKGRVERSIKDRVQKLTWFAMLNSVMSSYGYAVEDCFDVRRHRDQGSLYASRND